MKRKLGLTLVWTAAFWAALLVSKVVHDHAAFWVWCVTNLVVCSVLFVLFQILAKRAENVASSEN